MSLQEAETSSAQTSSKERKGAKQGNDMANGGHYEDRTSESVHLLSLHGEEDDEPPTRVKWLPLKEHKKLMLYQWSGLSKKTSFIKKMKKAGKEEKTVRSKVKKAKIQQSKTEDAFSGVSHDRMSRLHHMIGPFRRRTSKNAGNNIVSSAVEADLSENKHGPEWLEDVSMRSYIMQKILELSGQLPTEEIGELENKTDYPYVLSKDDQNPVSQVQTEIEKVNGPIYVENADLQVHQKKLWDQEEDHLNNELPKIHQAIDEEDVDLRSVDGFQNPSTQLISSEESSSDACTMQNKVWYSHDKDSLLTVIQSPASPKLVGGTPISGPLRRKCWNYEALMKEITAVKNRQDFLENECLQLRSRYVDNNIVMELLQEQHLRYSQLLVNMNDLREQQNVEVENMKEVIVFMEDKIAYQSYERTRDIWDEMGLFQYRLSKIEAEQKQQTSPTLGKDANSQVKNLLPTFLTNTSQILSGKVMKTLLPIIVTVLLIVLTAVSINDIPFVTAAIYTTYTVNLLYGVLHHWSAVSATLQRSWLVTHAMHLFERLINNYDFSSALEEAWELLFEG